MGFIREVRKDIEQEALRLIREYYAMLAGEARRLGADEHSARDLAIKAIETYLEKPEGELPDESGVRSWLVATLRNHYHHFVRGKARACTVYLDPEDVERLAELGPADNSTDEAILAHSDAEFVRNVISRLPESTRSVLMLRYFESLSIRQIAELLRKSPDSVRSNLYYARKVLAKRLGKAFGRSALAIAALLFGGSLLYAAAVVAGFAPSPFAAAEPVAEDAEFDFNAKNTENTEGALTGFTGFPTEGTDPKPADPSLSSQAPATNHETNWDSPQQVEAITDNSNTNNEENAMNTKLVKSAAVKALALGAMLMSTPAQAADYYVAKTGSDSNPGTQGAPFATIGKAITEANTAIDGGADSATIYVGDGTYAEHTLTLEKPITIVGESGNRDAVIVNPNGSASNPRRAFTLNHAAATVSGITMKNGHARGSGNLGAGGNVRIDSNGGVVTNCVVANGYAAGGGNIRLNGAGALVVDCVVTNGTADWSRGGNIYAYTGLVSRCFVANGTVKAGGTDTGDAGNAYLGLSAVMENCLVMGGSVADNSTGNANGVYLADESRLVNCTIVKNRTDSRAHVPAVNASASTVRVVNCVIYGNGGTAAREWGNANGACYVNCATASGAAITGGTGNIATLTDSAFADYAGGDYHPQKKGVLYNAGTGRDEYFAFGAESLFDLGRSDRISGARLDIGCYEFYVSGSVFYFR